MTIDADDKIEAELNAFNDQLVKHNLTPTWAYYQELVTMEPMPSYKAYLWKAELLDYVVGRAAELVDLERGGERRSFEVVNPDLRHLHGTTHTIGARPSTGQAGRDRAVAPPSRVGTSWNSAHASPRCSQANLQRTVGAGLFNASSPIEPKRSPQAFSGRALRPQVSPRRA